MLIARPTYQKWLWDLKDQNLIKVLTGVRRVGKSTLLQMHADRIVAEGVPENRILILNFEDPDVYTLGDWKQIYDHIKVQLDPDHMNYVFLDEVQNVPVFERLVDGLFIKKNVDLYVTGSNSFFLSGELATLLTGRSIEKHILPLNFPEYLEMIKNIDNSNDNDFRNSQNFSVSKSFGNFIYYGSIPEAVSLHCTNKNAEDTFLEGVLNTIIHKDIYPRQRYYNDADFGNLLNFILDSIASIVSPNSISNAMRNNNQIIDHKTIRQYLQDLCDSYLFYKVPRYDLKGKKLLKTLGKYYCVDPGFRRTRLHRLQNEDSGHLLENAVYFELLRRYPKVCIGKVAEKEIDFVCMDYDNRRHYYQVAYNAMSDDTLKRELSSFTNIRDNHPKFLLSTDALPGINYNGIRHLNVVDWFLGEVG